MPFGWIRANCLQNTPSPRLVGHGAFLLKRQGRRGKGKEGKEGRRVVGCARNEMRLVQPLSSFSSICGKSCYPHHRHHRHSATAISSLLPLLSPFPSFPPLLSSSTNKTSNDDNRANPSHYNPHLILSFHSLQLSQPF